MINPCNASRHDPEDFAFPDGVDARDYVVTGCETFDEPEIDWQDDDFDGCDEPYSDRDDDNAAFYDGRED